MRKAERIITIIMLIVISLSNVGTPVAYAAEQLVVSMPAVQKSSGLSFAPQPKFAVDAGSVLGSSTSLLTVGTQQPLDLQEGNVGSAHQRIPLKMETLAKKVYQTDEDVQLAVVNPDNEAFSTSVADATGTPVTVPVTESNNGTTTTVDLAPSNEMKPGAYTVKITDQDGKSITQDFSWGVLALNTDKSEYHPGETGDIAMAVLNDKGDMVCDASLILHITNSQLGIDDTLATNEASTSVAQTDTASSSATTTSGTASDTNTASSSATASDNQITVNPQCQTHDFSLQPDYEAHYTFKGTGTYNFQLTATTENGSHTITDDIPVTNQIPFDVQRVSATRIYPPNTYPMTFNITAHQNFSGIVTETVPEDFTITPATESAQDLAAQQGSSSESGGVPTSYDNMQTLYLNSNDPAAQLGNEIATASGGLVMPFHGSYPITQGFGAQLTDPTLQAFYTQYGLAGHDGIDFGVPMDTPLYAVDNGTVIWSGPGDYGITVIIQHSWGESYYGHLSNTSVTVGQSIGKGQLLGYSGESGEATGPHLHFGMRPNNPDMQNGYYGKVDPMPYLPIGQGQSPTSLGPVTQPTAGATSVTPAIGTTVLGASDSATASSSAQVSPIPTSTPTVTPDASPSATPAPLIVTPTAEEQAPTPTPNLENTPASTTVADSNFTVLDKEIQLNEELANSSQTEKVKVLTWQVSLKKGESTTLGYDYQIPHVSPQFYLVGPVKMYASGSDKVVYQEKRQWELASDDVGVEWYNNTTGSAWNGYSWQYRKKLVIDHTKVTATPTFGTVTKDSSPAGTNEVSYNGASVTWSHTVGGSCANAILIVSVASDYYQNFSTGATYGGIAMTELPTQGFNNNDLAEVYYMTDANLTSLGKGSAHTVSVGMIAGTKDEVLGSVSFCNVNQSSPLTSTPSSGSASQPSISVSSTTTNQAIFSVLSVDDGSDTTPSSQSGTNLWGFYTSEHSNSQYQAGTNGTSTVSENFAHTPTNWAMIAVALNPATTGTTPLSNFPVLVSISGDTNLSSHSPTGTDILFTDSTGETLLPYEIENYSSGTLQAWVQIASLSGTADTIIYMYYGNPSAPGNTTANAQSTWNSNYKGVWHFGPTVFGGATLATTDSTNNANTGTDTSVTYTASGEIDGAGVFASGSKRQADAGTDLDNLSAMTISGWMDPSSTGQNSRGRIMDKSATNTPTAGWTFHLAGTNQLSFQVAAATTALSRISTTSVFTTSVWSYVTLTWDGSTSASNVHIYVNGTEVGSYATTTNMSGTRSSDTTSTNYIGDDSASDSSFVGDLDEIRISNAVLSSYWIQTEFTNQNTPGPGAGDFFSSIGTEETKIYAPTMHQLLRHGQWFNSEGSIQPFMF